MAMELEWTKLRDVSRDTNEYVASRYRIVKLIDRRWYLYGRSPGRYLWNSFGTLKAAKDAAQHEYEELKEAEAVAALYRPFTDNKHDFGPS